MSGWGKPGYGTSSYKNFRLEGDKLGNEKFYEFRILPPFKSLAARKQWFVRQKQHFGYRGTDKKAKTFLCIEDKDFKTGVVRVECPECVLIEQRKEALAQIEAELKAEGRPEADIKAMTKSHRDWLSSHNLDRKFLLLVKTNQGEMGVLSIPFRAKEDLDAKIAKLKKDHNIEPIEAEQGVTFIFSRSGTELATKYSVSWVEEIEMVNGKKFSSPKLAPLTEADYTQAEETLPDLTQLGRRLTVDQIQALVDTDGDPAVVDQVFNTSTTREQSASPKSPAPVVETKTVKTEPKVEPKPPLEVPKTEVLKEVDWENLSDEEFRKIYQQQKRTNK